MEPKTVRQLEKKLEDAIAGVIVVGLGLKHLPLLPDRHAMQSGCAGSAGRISPEVPRSPRVEPAIDASTMRGAAFGRSAAEEDAACRQGGYVLSGFQPAVEPVESFILHRLIELVRARIERAMVTILRPGLDVDFCEHPVGALHFRKRV